MEKVRYPRFVDHVDLGEKPKYKSFLLRMHREATASQQAKDENLQRENVGETNLDMIPKRMLPHPKKRMQMYKEMKAFDDTSNEGDRSDASRKSFEPNVPNEYPKRHPPTRELLHLLTRNCQPHVTSNTADYDKLQIANAPNQFLGNNWKSESDLLEKKSVNWLPPKSDTLSTNYMQHFGQRKEVYNLTMHEYSRSNREYNQNEQGIANNFNFDELKNNIISESDQNNYGISEIVRCDESTRNHVKKGKNICNESLMEYETSIYPPNSHIRVYAPNGAIHFSPRKLQHSIYSKQNLDVFNVNKKKLTITSNPEDLQLCTNLPQLIRSTTREKLPRVSHSFKTEKLVYPISEINQVFPIIENNPQLKRLQGDHPSTWPQTVTPYPVYTQRHSENPEDLRLPHSSRLLEELISAVSSRRQRELPQLVPSRPVRTKQLHADDGAFQDHHGLHRKRHPNGDVEQWQHGRRREHNGHRSVGEPYPPHSSVSQPNRNYQPPTIPYPRTSPEGGPPFPPASSQHGYGYNPPGPYHPYSREDNQAPPKAPPPLSARDKTISWLSGGEPQCPSPPRAAGSSSYIESKAAARKVDDYKIRPMSEWESRDVAHFLIEATHDLGIRYENTDFSQLNQVDGRKLLSMEPKHFEKFTPTEGQRVYDYVRRHRNHEMLTKEGQSENFRSDGPHQSIMTPPPISVDTSTSSTFSSDVYGEYPLITPSPTLNGSMAYDLQSNTISAQPFHGPDNTSIPVGTMGPPIPPDPIQLNPYQSPGIVPSHSSAGYPPQSGGMFASTSDQYQYPVNSVSSVSHMRPDGPHLSADSFPTAVNKTFYPLHDPSTMYPSPDSDERDHNGIMRHEDGRHPHHAEMRPPSSMFTDFSEQEESSDDDDDEEEEEEEREEEVVKTPEPPKKRGPGRPPKPESERKKKKRTGRLWEFIRNLLLNPETCPSIVKWEDAETGVFRFVQSEKVADRWGMRKNNQKMNYEKLSRAMRYYYKGKVFEPVLGRRLVYKFGANAKGWKPNNANFGQ